MSSIDIYGIQKPGLQQSSIKTEPICPNLDNTNMNNNENIKRLQSEVEKYTNSEIKKQNLENFIRHECAKIITSNDVSTLTAHTVDSLSNTGYKVLFDISIYKNQLLYNKFNVKIEPKNNQPFLNYLPPIEVENTEKLKDEINKFLNENIKNENNKKINIHFCILLNPIKIYFKEITSEDYSQPTQDKKLTEIFNIDIDKSIENNENLKKDITNKIRELYENSKGGKKTRKKHRKNKKKRKSLKKRNKKSKSKK